MVEELQRNLIIIKTYLTLRQMKLLDIAETEIRTVIIAQIQDLETMGFQHVDPVTT
jgi:hypothetical protein